MKFAQRIFTSCLMLACVGFAQTIGFADRDARYRLQPLDVLELHFRYSPELDQTATVQPDGFISLPVVGDIKLQGMTTEEAKAAIIAQASKRLRTPEIALVLKEFVKPYFIVGGEVGAPGRFEMHGKVNALEAIEMAGGLKTTTANHAQVILYRRAGPDLARAELLDLRKSIEHRGHSEPLPDLRSGDMLIVPQNRVSRIERFVKWATVTIYPPL